MVGAENAHGTLELRLNVEKAEVEKQNQLFVLFENADQVPLLTESYGVDLLDQISVELVHVQTHHHAVQVDKLRFKHLLRTHSPLQHPLGNEFHDFVVVPHEFVRFRMLPHRVVDFQLGNSGNALENRTGFRLSELKFGG